MFEIFMSHRVYLIFLDVYDAKLLEPPWEEMVQPFVVSQHTSTPLLVTLGGFWFPVTFWRFLICCSFFDRGLKVVVAFPRCILHGLCCSWFSSMAIHKL